MDVMSNALCESLSSRSKIIDVREQRRMAAPMEFREDVGAGQVVLEGYAATFEAYDCYGGVERGGWVEQIDRRAFSKTLNQNPDVQLLLNHEGLPLARTTSGTLVLSADNRGLKVRAMLDAADPDVQRILPKMRRGDLNEMSFAFRVKDQKWDDNYHHRLITEVSLQRGDVSVVSYGMNPDTNVMVSRRAVEALTHLTEEELTELRDLGADTIDAAVDALRRAAHSVPTVGVTGPKRSDGNPGENMINSTLAGIGNGSSVGVQPASVGKSGTSVQVTKTGSAGKGIKMVIDPLVASQVQELELAVVSAYQSAETDSMRSMLADCLAKAAVLRSSVEVGDADDDVAAESSVDKKLRIVRAAKPEEKPKEGDDDDVEAPADEEEKADCECWDGYSRVPGTKPCEPGSCQKRSENPFAEDEDDEDEEKSSCDDEEKKSGCDDEEAKSESEEDEDEKSGDDEDDEDMEERSLNVADRLRSLHGKTGIPVINNVDEGLAYVSSFRRGK